MLRIVVAEDDDQLAELITSLLSEDSRFEVVGRGRTGDEAVELASEHRPDIVLMDLSMPGCDGVEATRRLQDQAPAVDVLVLTTYADDRSLLAALRAGARGYLTKDAGADQVQEAIRAVARGEAAIDPAVQHHLIDAVAAGPAEALPSDAPSPLPDGLTPREAEVLGLVAQGLSNNEIATRLVVSEATVKSHINHLFTKTGVRDRAQAVTYAFKHGLVAGD